MYRDTFKPRIPPPTDVHKLFGDKYINAHLIEDARWTPPILGNQYKCIVDFLNKNNELQKIEYKIDEKKQKKRIHYYENKIHTGHEKLKQIDFANAEKVQSILKNYKELLKLCEILPRDQALEKISQHEFEKRKENDKLHFEMEQLSKEYAEKLKQLTLLDDKIKFPEPLTEGEKEIKVIRKQLTNFETRLRAIKTIRKTYWDIIQILGQDAIYYNTVLDALQNDIEDQENFIEHVLHYGRINIKKLPQLQNDYIKSEIKRKRIIKIKIDYLKQYQEKLKVDHKELLSIINREYNPNNAPSTYQFETSSILNLKTEITKLENVMDELKHATSTIRIKHMVYSVKSGEKDNRKLNNIIDLLEDDEKLTKEKEILAKQVKEFLSNNVSKDDIDRLKTIQKLDEKIENEKLKQKKLAEEINEKGKVHVYVSWALSHINSTLRSNHDTYKRGKSREYPTEDLKLNLLDFDTFKMQKLAEPPLTYETDLLQHINIARNKLMKMIGEFKHLSKKDIAEAKFMFENNFKNNFAPNVLEEKIVEIVEEPESKQHEDNREVRTRNQIKYESMKIVEQHLEDD